MKNILVVLLVLILAMLVFATATAAEPPPPQKYLGVELLPTATTIAPYPAPYPAPVYKSPVIATNELPIMRIPRRTRPTR